MRITHWPHKLRRFAALSAADQWLFVRAVARLAIARVQLAIMPFDRLAARLASEEPGCDPNPDPQLLRRIHYAVTAAAGNVPWRSDCFPQSIAAHALLRNYGLASTIHLGVERIGDDAISGHAWLTCGDEIVVGGEESGRYTEMHRFSA